MNLFEFLKDDWNKIPQNLRYFIYIGLFLIINSWFLDHWGLQNPYLFWVFDIRQTGYSAGLTLIFIAFGLLILKQISHYPKVLWYRHKFPVNQINKKYYLVWFNQTLYLFDLKNLKYHHVHPWESAQDLKFVGRGDDLGGDIRQYNGVVKNGKQIIDMSKYTEGDPINTQT